MTSEPIKVTVGVKALNEETHIAMALASALEAVRPFGGEVVLADSGSRDRTIEIARRLPVRVFQLANPEERCCGAGAQLAFQHARGEYFYLLDGDMVIVKDFLKAGIAYLDAYPGCAGVGGHVYERNTAGEEFQVRAASLDKPAGAYPREVDRLDCGGLYRTAAIREVGYFADRNLHAFEEYELAARLQQRGYKLARIDHPMVEHFGHTLGGYRLLWRRLRSGYAGGAGEVLRAAIGRRHLGIVLRQLAHVRTSFAVMAWWAALLAAPFVSLWLFLVVLLLPALFLAWRRGSPRLGLYSLASWNVTAIGLIAGFLRSRVAPNRPLDSVQIAPESSAVAR